MKRSFVLSFLATAVYSSSSIAQVGLNQASGFDALGRPAWVTSPKTAIAESATPEQAAIRSARSSMFDVPGAKPLVSHNEGEKSFPGGGGFDELPQGNPIPTAMSDVVVVAFVSSFQPFQSNDKSMVYSELTTIPSEVIKDPLNLLGSKTNLIILQRGGTLRTGDGKVVNAVPYGGSNPIRLNTRYLLFLQFHKKAQAFTVLRAWDLSGQRPLEMDGDGHPYTDRVGALEDSLRSEAELKKYVKVH